MELQQIASFSIDHKKLLPGVYVSRRDYLGQEVITTIDIRMKAPNREPVMNMAPLHTLEHLGATYLRSRADWAQRIVYFGPMGCRTGLYLVLHGQLSSAEALPLVEDMFRFMAQFEGEVPGAKECECGNYLDHNLAIARWESQQFLEHSLSAGPCLEYPS